MTQIRWIASVSASCFHAAAAMLRGKPLLDRELAQALAEGVQDLQTAIEATGTDVERFLDHLTALSGGIEHNPELASVLLRKTIGAGPYPQLRDCLARAFTGLELATLNARPNLLDEVGTAGEALQLEWEHAGAALLRRVGEMTDEALLPEAATVFLVHPSTGQSAAHLPYNCVTVETPADGGVTQFAWLLAQLNLDLPRFSERLECPAAAARFGALALVPLVLSAAAEQELTACDTATLRETAAAWRPDDADDETLTRLESWWDVFRTSDTPWDLALAALERMLNEPAMALA